MRNIFGLCLVELHIGFLTKCQHLEKNIDLILRECPDRQTDPILQDRLGYRQESTKHVWFIKHRDTAFYALLVTN